MTAVLASTSVQMRAGILPHVGSAVLAALPLRCIMRAMEAAMTKAPSAKVESIPMRVLRFLMMPLIIGRGRRKTWETSEFGVLRRYSPRKTYYDVH